MRSAASSGVRLAELVATISLGTDLGLGQSMEHILRQTLVSLRMAELLAFDEAEREVAYFSGLLAWVGCHTDAYEQAKWFGDDIALKRDGYHYDMGRPVDLLAFAWHTVGRGRPPLERFKTWLELPLAVRRSAMVDLRNHWLAADELASRLGLSEPVRRSLKESFASAQEVVQEAWLAMIQGLDKFEGRSSLRTWMLAILETLAAAAAYGSREPCRCHLSAQTRATGRPWIPTASAVQTTSGLETGRHWANRSRGRAHPKRRRWLLKAVHSSRMAWLSSRSGSGRSSPSAMFTASLRRRFLPFAASVPAISVCCCIADAHG